MKNLERDERLEKKSEITVDGRVWEKKSEAGVGRRRTGEKGEGGREIKVQGGNETDEKVGINTGKQKECKEQKRDHENKEKNEKVGFKSWREGGKKGKTEKKNKK